MIRLQFLLMLVSSTILAQHIANTFRYPLAGTVELSGNYAEIRPNHFHAGLDLRTDKVKNLPVYAIEDGYVSRIKVSTYGYGKVLYITHPNGYVSVYAHQHHYSATIAKFVKAAQSISETFEIELFPKPEELPVKKSEIIGYTGNTGNSNGPHLHFEIREEKSEVPMNPLRFYDLPDTEAPEIKGVFLYDLNDMESPRKIKDVLPQHQKLKSGVLEVPSCFGLGISAFDTEKPNGNLNQVYSIEIRLDNAPFFKLVFDSIAFDKARYVNCFTDLSTALRSKKIQKCFLSRNEELPFKLAVNNGEVMLTDTLLHTLQFIVSDITGNKKEMNLEIKQKKKSCSPTVAKAYDCLKPLSFQQQEYLVSVAEKTFFNDYNLKVENRPKDAAYLCSNKLILKGSDLPFFKSIDISLKPLSPAEKKADKLCLAELPTHSYCGGEYSNGMVSGKTKSAGTFALIYDTTAPSIKPYPLLQKTKNIAAFKTLSFYVSDDFSGIGQFRMELNGKWVLAEYEHKSNTLFYTLSEETPKGTVSLVLSVSDKKGNQSVFASSYTN